MTGGMIIAALAAALLVLWWLADHDRGMRWTVRAVRRSFPEVPSISPADLRSWLGDESRTRPVLLDVRSEEEFAVSHLCGARRTAPEAAAPEALTGAEAPRPLVLYCAGGYRAARLARRLMAAGRHDVSNLEGGIFAWVNAGYPVERDGRVVTGVHPVSRLFRRLLRKDAR
jgi:rhodanese-related sulfurtransferase